MVANQNERFNLLYHLMTFSFLLLALKTCLFFIRHNGDTTGIPVYAFVEDMACSGGYLLAAAADTIYVSTFSSGMDPLPVD